jgi:hypothetical protein
MMWLLCILGLAQADGIHTGVPVQGVEGLGEASFQTANTGWTAFVDDGIVRVFVARDEAGAKAWIERMRQAMAKYKPLENPDFLANSVADEAYGDGQGLLIFRDGNVGVQVRNKNDATTWAEILQLAISDEPVPWPTPAALIEGPEFWTVQTGPEIAHIAFEGGRLARHKGLRFTQPPRALIVWDKWGRATRSTRQSTDEPTPVSDPSDNTIP